MLRDRVGESDFNHSSYIFLLQKILNIFGFKMTEIEEGSIYLAY